MQFGLTILLIIADLCAAPYLWHVCRFPNVPRGLIQANCRFNREYQDWVRRHYELDRDSQWVTAMLKESELLWKAYDCLDDARNEMFSIPRRRKALGELLSIIGPEAFERGEMPLSIPLHWFKEIR